MPIWRDKTGSIYCLNNHKVAQYSSVLLPDIGEYKLSTSILGSARKILYFSLAKREESVSAVVYYYQV